MGIKIALAGNPNCGKTTMFNSLTGASQYVGNWPGVTVEKKEGKAKGFDDVVVTDLPGIYSLSPYTSEEIVSRDYLASDEPDSVINIVDATNIERNLYLTTQILELGKPVVLALNMVDSLKKSGDKIDVKKLGEKLGIEIVETVALHNRGVKEAVQAAVDAAKKNDGGIKKCFSSEIENAISDVMELLPSSVAHNLKRWTAIKVIERDSVVLGKLDMTDEAKAKAESVTAELEKKNDDDIESIITNERYNYITDLLGDVVVKSGKKMTTSDKVDSVVTNRFLGIPIFLGVMWFVYYLSISTVGLDERHALRRASDWKIRRIPRRRRRECRPRGLHRQRNNRRRRNGSRVCPADGRPLLPPFNRGGCRIHGANRVRHGSRFQKVRAFGKIVHPAPRRNRLRRSRNHGVAHD